MRRPAAGFTLIEVLVAMTIFALVSAAIVSLMYTTTTMISQNNAASQAIVLAQGTMEDLRTLAYQDIPPDGLYYDEWKGTRFTVTWDVDEDVPEPGMKTIVVQVSWDSKGEPKIYETRSVYSRVTA